MTEMKVKLLTENAKLPQKSSGGAAGFDLCADLASPQTLAPMQRTLISTGIAIALPSNEYVALVFARSGLSTKHGIALTNGVGVVDSDYRGEIKVGLVNLSHEPYTIHPGDRIAQILISPVAPVQVRLTAELSETERGDGGFGSTGR